MRSTKTIVHAVLIGVSSAPLVPLAATAGPPAEVEIPGVLAVSAAVAEGSTDYEWFDPIIVVRRFLLDGFYEPPDEQAIQVAMIDAMIETLDDPYTLYVPPSGEAEFNKALRGTYVGIGAEVNVVHDSLTVVSPLEDSPALAAGVQAGDIVLEIEGEPTLDHSIDDCLELLLGEPGTPVTIRVRHLDGTEQDLSIVRQQIVTPTVKGVQRRGQTWDHWLDEPGGIAYVRITQFIDPTVAHLKESLHRLQESGLEGLVLDLRGNPGGELTVAIETADLLLAEGTIVSVKGRSRRPQSWQARPEGTLGDFAMVVMVNRHSASAAEIVAGALQDNGRAKVLGTRTFGKGSVQEVHELPYGQGTLKMTSGHYYLSSGRNIARTSDGTVWGVDPDPGFVVSMSDESFLEVIKARQRFEIIRPGASPTDANFADPDWIRAHLKDHQLAAALEALQTRLQSGNWPVVGGDDPTRLALDQRIGARMRFRRQLMEQLDAVEKGLQSLNQLAEQAGRQPLLPPDADLTDGSLTIRDQDGNVVGAFRLVGGDLEFALRQLQLDRIRPQR